MFFKLQLVTVLAVLTIYQANADFSSGFLAFLNQLYGTNATDQLRRLDLAPDASYGGGNSSKHFKLDKDPVVLVHGVSSYAGRLTYFVNYFNSNGYANGSVFATSYGPTGRNIGVNDTISCEYFKQVRRLIKAVHLYTGRKVNVIAYSMGSAVSRKAILGGVCFDNNKHIGKTVTSYVNVFLSDAGVNQGLYLLCSQNPGSPICVSANGVQPGSQLIQNINSKVHYEGKRVYLIASTTDEVVGYNYIQLPGANINITLTGPNHVGSGVYTTRTQLSLIRNHTLTQQILDADMAGATVATGVNCTGSF